MIQNENSQSSTAQRWKILSYLQDGGEVTSLSMLNLFGCYDGRKRISELRKLGYPIKDKPGFSPGSRKHFKIYYMEQKGQQ